MNSLKQFLRSIFSRPTYTDQNNGDEVLTVSNAGGERVAMKDLIHAMHADHAETENDFKKLIENADKSKTGLETLTKSLDDLNKKAIEAIKVRNLKTAIVHCELSREIAQDNLNTLVLMAKARGEKPDTSFYDEKIQADNEKIEKLKDELKVVEGKK